MPLGVDVGLGPGYIALDGDPAPPMERVTAALNLSIVAKWLPISATAEHLSILLMFQGRSYKWTFRQVIVVQKIQFAVCHT